MMTRRSLFGRLATMAAAVALVPAVAKAEPVEDLSVPPPSVTLTPQDVWGSNHSLTNTAGLSHTHDMRIPGYTHSFSAYDNRTLERELEARVMEVHGDPAAIRFYQEDVRATLEYMRNLPSARLNRVGNE